MPSQTRRTWLASKPIATLPRAVPFGTSGILGSGEVVTSAGNSGFQFSLPPYLRFSIFDLRWRQISPLACLRKKRRRARPFSPIRQEARRRRVVTWQISRTITKRKDSTPSMSQERLIRRERRRSLALALGARDPRKAQRADRAEDPVAGHKSVKPIRHASAGLRS